jgi:hypothetical protein
MKNALKKARIMGYDAGLSPFERARRARSKGQRSHRYSRFWVTPAGKRNVAKRVKEDESCGIRWRRTPIRKDQKLCRQGVKARRELRILSHPGSR